jgi:hypothetical protein
LRANERGLLLASVADPVFVGVGLGVVRRPDAIVAGISDTVTIVIGLTLVLRVDAVIITVNCLTACAGMVSPIVQNSVSIRILPISFRSRFFFGAIPVSATRPSREKGGDEKEGRKKAEKKKTRPHKTSLLTNCLSERLRNQE